MAIFVTYQKEKYCSLEDLSKLSKYFSHTNLNEFPNNWRRITQVCNQITDELFIKHPRAVSQVNPFMAKREDRQKRKKKSLNCPGETRRQSCAINLKKKKKRVRGATEMDEATPPRQMFPLLTPRRAPLRRPPPPSQSSPLYRPFFCWLVTEQGRARQGGAGHAGKCPAPCCPSSPFNLRPSSRRKLESREARWKRSRGEAGREEGRGKGVRKLHERRCYVAGVLMVA